MKLFDKINWFGKNRVKKTGREIRKDDKMIKVRFQSMLGERNIIMTIRELQKNYKDYLIINPIVGEKINIEDLSDLDISEVLAKPPSEECC
ncbi:MAG: hypothetical protein FIB07_17140 [Candidatus Methanoperedens sp.]|nr:hypothetical protein [Candidatus Methanoperedens sp.]